MKKRDFDDTLVALDTYNSDLNLIIDPSRFSGQPLTSEGFALMWAGARATYGIIQGKTCFEVRVVQHIVCPHLPADEPNSHVVRLGFSVDSTSVQLGEEPLSYGYDGTGKKSTNCEFVDYGEKFIEGDVVMALLNMDTDPVQIGFAKNGQFVGWAYKISKSVLKGQPLFPHVLSKNCTFEVNFGQKEIPYFNLPQGFQQYTFLGCIPLDLRVCGGKAPGRLEDCEVIMMCGLPGAGKSRWAAEHSKKHADKKYNVLGTSNIFDKMKVMGLPRKKDYAGCSEVLVKMATKCMNKMFEIGSRLQRNYILDQTNVYPTAQRRNMRNFEGFKRRAAVVVPPDLEFQKRINKKECTEGKDVPDRVVLEMKANFKLPVVGDVFDDVFYIELQKEEAEKLVHSYNEEGQAAVRPVKRFHGNKDYSLACPAMQSNPSCGSGRNSGNGFRDGPARNQWKNGSNAPRQNQGTLNRCRYGSGSFRGLGGNHNGRGGPQGDLDGRDASNCGSKEGYRRSGHTESWCRNELGGRNFGSRTDEFVCDRGDYSRGDHRRDDDEGRSMFSANFRDKANYGGVGELVFNDCSGGAPFGYYEGRMCGDYLDHTEFNSGIGGCKGREEFRQGLNIDHIANPYGEKFENTGSTMSYSGHNTSSSNDGPHGRSQSDISRRGGPHGGYQGRGGESGFFDSTGGHSERAFSSGSREHLSNRDGSQVRYEGRSDSQGRYDGSDSEGRYEGRSDSQGRYERKGGSQGRYDGRGDFQGGCSIRGGSQAVHSTRGGSHGGRSTRGGSQAGYSTRGGSHSGCSTRGGSQAGYSTRGGSHGEHNIKDGFQGGDSEESRSKTGYCGKGELSGSYGKDNRPNTYSKGSGSFGGRNGKDHVQGNIYNKDSQLGGYSSDTKNPSVCRSGDAQNAYKVTSARNQACYDKSSIESWDYSGNVSQGFDGEQHSNYSTGSTQSGHGNGFSVEQTSRGSQNSNRSGNEKKKLSQDNNQASIPTEQTVSGALADKQASYNSYSNVHTASSGSGIYGTGGYGNYNYQNQSYGQTLQQQQEKADSYYLQQNIEQSSAYNCEQAQVNRAVQACDLTGLPGATSTPAVQQAWCQYWQPQESGNYTPYYGFTPDAPGYGGTYGMKTISAIQINQ